jgi:mannose-6-phosphate isomerase
MLYPLLFHPLPQERVWGGRRLEEIYGRKLPSNGPFGESWEICDRPGAVSIVANGPLAGRDMRWLMENYVSDLLGMEPPSNGRFPLLFKILDAAETLSLQVHPPTGATDDEPKSEAWYVAHASADAHLFAGLCHGITRDHFENKLREGELSDCVPRLPLCAGDAMFLPSGRLHALGGGTLVFEIQQNSDTTYRVYDWNRMGLDGKPRELHIKSALEAIDFDDIEPALSPTTGNPRVIADATGLFRVELHTLAVGDTKILQCGMTIIAVVTGELRLDELTLTAGTHCLVPACLSGTEMEATKETSLLLTLP